jgi:hypothetical protein
MFREKFTIIRHRTEPSFAMKIWKFVPRTDQTCILVYAFISPQHAGLSPALSMLPTIGVRSVNVTALLRTGDDKPVAFSCKGATYRRSRTQKVDRR